MAPVNCSMALSSNCVRATRQTGGLRTQGRVLARSTVRRAALSRPTRLVVKASADEDVLLKEEEAVMAQIAALKKENEELAARLNIVKDKTVKQEAANAERTVIKAKAETKAQLGSMAGLKVTDGKVVTEDSPDAPLDEAQKMLKDWLHRAEVPKTDDPLSIVFVSSETAPWSKTGGLGDVAGSLPPAFADRGHRCMVITPMYLNSKTKPLYQGVESTGKKISVYLFGSNVEVELFHLYKNNVDYVFLSHPAYAREGNPYGNEYGAFGDNLFRYCLLSLVACEVPLQLELGGYVYGDKCVFLANDWHASMTCLYVSSKYRPYGVFKDARTILCIHNMAHHGTEASTVFGSLGVPDDWYGCLEYVFPEHMRAHELDKGEAVNPMKGAIVTADRLLTVSQGYAYEITTEEGGFGLEQLLRGRQHVLNGIVNGVDIDEWDPATDQHIAEHYWPGNMHGKKECKKALQKELGLREDEHVPVIGFIGRLDFQKGADLIQDAVHNHGLLHQDVQVIMLGSGDPGIEDWMAWAEENNKDKFRGWRGFSVPTAHRMMAGCDILLMPSRFEPCGLNQLYSMRYGTVPVAHATGGLKDTIEDFNPYAHEKMGAGTGLTFSPFSGEAMMGSLCSAIDTYRHHKDQWEGIQRRGMDQDMSWQRSAAQYEQVFRWAMIDPPYA